MSFRVLRSFAIVLSATLAFGCADSPAAPQPTAPIAVDADQQQLLGGILNRAYFPDDTPGLRGPVGSVLSALKIVTSVTMLRPDRQPEVQTWLLNHFSRYMLASG